jgi:hypothetical protein
MTTPSVSAALSATSVIHSRISLRITRPHGLAKLDCLFGEKQPTAKLRARRCHVLEPFAVLAPLQLS